MSDARISDRERQALRALEARGGAGFASDLGLPGSPIGWGNTLGALSRRGLVSGVSPSVESAGVALYWTITRAGRDALT